MRLRRVCWSAFSSGMRTKSGPFADRADPRSARPRSHAVDVLGPGRSREAYAVLGIRFMMPTTGLRRLSRPPWSSWSLGFSPSKARGHNADVHSGVSIRSNTNHFRRVERVDSRFLGSFPPSPRLERGQQGRDD